MSFRFEHLTLQNWRNFRKVDVDLTERVFVYGPNASGKTNLLDAFRFLKEIAQEEGGLARAINERGGISHLRSLHARQGNVRIEVAARIDDEAWAYALEVSGTKTRPFQIVQERVEREGNLLLNRPNPADGKDPRLLEQTHLQQLSQNKDFRKLVDGLASVRHVHVVPLVAKRSTRADEAMLRDAPGSDFIDQLAKLPDKKKAGMLRRIEKLLKKAVPQFSELDVQPDSSGTPHLEAKYRHWRAKGGWQNESDLSEGTLRLVGSFWALLTGDEPLLLEEPELSLHRDVVRQLPGLLARASMLSERQVIVTTHAEEMLEDEGVAPEEVLILTPTSEDTLVRRASDDPQVANAASAGVPLGQLITAKTRPAGIEQLSLALEKAG